MIKAEKFLKSASSKNCCEDFVSTFMDKKGDIYMILTDGCSSSQGDVVLGSRWFHRRFERTAIECEDHIFIDDISLYKQILLEGKQEGLRWDDFLFTIFAVKISIRTDVCEVFRMGDGSFHYKDFDDNLFNFSYEYENNTPFYLGYFANSIFQSGDITLKDFKCLTNEPENDTAFCASITDDSFELGNELWNTHCFDLTKIKKLFCFSDGLSEIVDVSYEHLLSEMMKDKDSSQVFDLNIERRKANFLIGSSKVLDDFSFVMFEQEKE